MAYLYNLNLLHLDFKSGIDNYTEQDVEHCQKQLNRRPRKVLPELFTRNAKIPIKHMIQVLDGDFTFSPFKCRKRASALV